MADERLLWPNYVKGLTIILVVFGHAAIGAQRDVHMDSFAFQFIVKPFSQFRMPVFFFIAGMFAVRTMKRNWYDFCNRTLISLFYVFMVWNVIQWAFRITFTGYMNGEIVNGKAHALTFIDLLTVPFSPINILWFVWALFFYLLITRIFVRFNVVYLAMAAAILAVVPFDIEHYALRTSLHYYVYFMLGYVSAEQVLGSDINRGPRLTILAFLAYVAFTFPAIMLQIEDLPIMDVINGCLGIAMVLTACMLAAKYDAFPWLAYLGNKSLPIFVSHTIFTAATREALIRLHITNNLVLITLAATAVGVLVPLVMYHTLMRMGLPWFFERPSWLRLPERPGPGAPGAAVATS